MIGELIIIMMFSLGSILGMNWKEFCDEEDNTYEVKL